MSLLTIAPFFLQFLSIVSVILERLCSNEQFDKYVRSFFRLSEDDVIQQIQKQTRLYNEIMVI